MDRKIMKKLKSISRDKKAIEKLTKRMAFSHYLAQLTKEKDEWLCCGNIFKSLKDCSTHVSENHMDCVSRNASEIVNQFICASNDEKRIQPSDNTHQMIEKLKASFLCTCNKTFKVILFYSYTNIPNPSKIVAWQKSLCEHLKLLGKIRVATEGINGTLEGCDCAIIKYIDHTMEYFSKMCHEDFKISDGNVESFKELVIKEHEELCSIGIPPDKLKPTEGARHLNPDEFHHEMEELLNNDKEDTVLVDCRNFYESKIGHFEKALKPDLRKFSYFPTYVDKNAEIFRDKRVLMYCTGGIRCERASAYMKQTGVCKDVLQLKGGIHKYLEKYPDGYYKGKLFVFDERYSICGEGKPCVSTCKYCGVGHDRYQLCTTSHCCQLVLSCDDCRKQGKTACCAECQLCTGIKKPECECTRIREQIPCEKPDSRNEL